MIKVINDGKECFQSFEATVEVNDGGGMGHYTSDITGYGATREEALTNLNNQMIFMTNKIRIECALERNKKPTP